MALVYTFDAKIWVYSGQAAWHFVSLPINIADEIKEISSSLPRSGFGSLRVNVTCKDISWDTSIFPDKKSGSYLLPIKKDILKKSALTVDDMVRLTISFKDI